jgi:anti-anti-sigma factor
MSGLDFMDSTGLRLVVLASQRADRDGRRLTLVKGPEDVHRVFEITRMIDRLDFVDDAGEAMG